MSTQYCFVEIDVGNNLTLYIDGNSKITAGNGSYDDPKPNAFSLPHISTCPGATSQCMSACYIYGLQNNAPEVYKKYAQNERVMHRILLAESSMVRTAKMLGDWIIENCPDGFRWHVSGDIMSERYAKWISMVAQNTPSIRHWIYTRTFDADPELVGIENLCVNISADADNYKEACEVASKFKLRVCYMTRDGSSPDNLRAGDVIFPDYNLRGRELQDPTEHSWWQNLSTNHRRMVCPADFFGQSDHHRCGPCKKCLFPKTSIMSIETRRFDMLEHS